MIHQAKIEIALLARDALALQLAIAEAPVPAIAEHNARKILACMPQDCQEWWLGKCDMSHDPLDVEAEVWTLVQRLVDRL